MDDDEDEGDDPLKIETLIVSTKEDEVEMSPREGKSSLSSIHSSMTTGAMLKSEPVVPATTTTTSTLSALVVPGAGFGAASPKNAMKSNSYNNNNVGGGGSNEDDDEDQIDWASSEDDEIVKQEVEHFERNQVSLLYKLHKVLSITIFFLFIRFLIVYSLFPSLDSHVYSLVVLK